jgi:hypothetical protein
MTKPLKQRHLPCTLARDGTLNGARMANLPPASGHEGRGGRR